MPPGIGYPGIDPRLGLLLEARRNPGLLAQPAPRPPQAPPAVPIPGSGPQIRPQPVEQNGGGIRNALAQIFGGMDDPSLSTAQNEQARQRALLQAGLAGLAASSRPGATLTETLANAGMVGQQAGGQFRQQAAGQEARAQLRRIVQSGQTPDPGQVQQLMIEMLLQGDTEGAKAAAEMLKATSSEASRLMKVDTPNGPALVNPVTGETVRQFGPGEPELVSKDLGDRIIWYPEGRPERIVHVQPKGQSPGTEGDDLFQRTQGLSSAFEAVTSEAQDVANAYGTVLASADEPSAAGDLSLIFAFMKMIDPGSVVREGEFATAQNAPGIPDRVRAQYNRVLRGERFTDETRQDFVDRAEKLAQQRRRSLRPVLERFRSRAQQSGVDPDLFVFDPFAEVTGGGDVLDNY